MPTCGKRWNRPASGIRSIGAGLRACRATNDNERADQLANAGVLSLERGELKMRQVFLI